MNILTWYLIAGWSLGAVGHVLDIGRPRKPITPPAAVGEVIQVAVLVWAVLTFGAGR